MDKKKIINKISKNVDINHSFNDISQKLDFSVLNKRNSLKNTLVVASALSISLLVSITALITLNIVENKKTNALLNQMHVVNEEEEKTLFDSITYDTTDELKISNTAINYLYGRWLDYKSNNTREYPFAHIMDLESSNIIHYYYFKDKTIRKIKLMKMKCQ